MNLVRCFFDAQKRSTLPRSAAFLFCNFSHDRKEKAMFDKKNDAARNKKRADAIVYAGAADEVVLTQSDFESEAEFRRWKAWSDEDYKRTEKVMRKDYDHAIYGLEGQEIPAPEEEQNREVCIDEKKLRAILTERQFERLTLYAIRGMTVEQIAEQEGVAHQNVSKSIRQAKKKIKFFFEKQGAKVPF